MLIRRVARIGVRTVEIFRELGLDDAGWNAVENGGYFGAREQALCHYSPALIRNLEENWRAHERGD